MIQISEIYKLEAVEVILNLKEVFCAVVVWGKDSEP